MDFAWAFKEAHARFRAAIAGLDASQLNATLGEETNSIAVLVAHALGNERWVITSIAGEPLPRDRAAEFRTRAESPEDLLRLLGEADRLVDQTLSRVDDERLGSDVPDYGTGARWLLRCFGHLREHAAHAELTRQLLARG